MSRIKSQLRFGLWPETRAPASHNAVGLTVAARKLAETTLAELTRLGVAVAIDSDGRARFRAAQTTIPPIAKRIVETHGALIESYLKGGQDL